MSAALIYECVDCLEQLDKCSRCGNLHHDIDVFVNKGEGIVCAACIGQRLESACSLAKRERGELNVARIVTVSA